VSRRGGGRSEKETVKGSKEKGKLRKSARRCWRRRPLRVQNKKSDSSRSTQRKSGAGNGLKKKEAPPSKKT